MLVRNEIYINEHNFLTLTKHYGKGRTALYVYFTVMVMSSCVFNIYY